MENQATQTIDPIANLTAKVLTALMEGINQMVDERVERIMATQASAAVFNDSLEARIREIAQEETSEKLDDIDNEISDKVVSAWGDLDITDSVSRAFQHHVNWEECVQEYVDNELDDKIETEVSNQIDDAVESKLDDMLEEKIREVLINIIKGE